MQTSQRKTSTAKTKRAATGQKTRVSLPKRVAAKVVKRRLTDEEMDVLDVEEAERILSDPNVKFVPFKPRH